MGAICDVEQATRPKHRGNMNLEELKQDLIAATIDQLTNAMGVYAFALATYDWPEEAAVGMTLKLLDELMDSSDELCSGVEKGLVHEAKKRTEAAIVEALRAQRGNIGRIKAVLGEKAKTVNLNEGITHAPHTERVKN